ncbi:chorismate mutase [Croceicoccus sp. YJ47]|uniref:chorismate mutase n=1 Tax=Croceicoccus sp. YJ47 TaxID=2798724 RepID=UPI00192229F3|nr:chorismate mutase [Croceicoccus sp. YJ47]QQN74110.1 chorismate mutase [Croceicoccus sp. YJ47]
MTDTTLPASQCTTMEEVRAGVDETDRRIVALLADRFAYMRAASRIKPTRDAVRDEPRKRAVIDAAVAEAKNHELPADFVARMWEDMVETSIAYEMRHWDARRGG